MRGKILSLPGSDAVIPEQYFDTFRRSEYLEPEKALLLAILEDAIHCFQKYRTAEDRVGRERFHDAKTWIMDGGNDWIFSFDTVCELLRLDPQYVRRGLQGRRAKRAEDEKPRRRYGSPRHAA